LHGKALYTTHKDNWRLRPNMRSSPHKMFADAYAMRHGDDAYRRKLAHYALDLAAFMRGVHKEIQAHVEDQSAHSVFASPAAG